MIEASKCDFSLLFFQRRSKEIIRIFFPPSLPLILKWKYQQNETKAGENEATEFLSHLTQWTIFSSYFPFFSISPSPSFFPFPFLPSPTMNTIEKSSSQWEGTCHFVPISNCIRTIFSHRRSHDLFNIRREMEDRTFIQTEERMEIEWENISSWSLKLTRIIIAQFSPGVNSEL